MKFNNKDIKLIYNIVLRLEFPCDLLIRKKEFINHHRAHPRCETLTFADILKRFVAGVINIKHIGFILVALYQACQGYA